MLAQHPAERGPLHLRHRRLVDVPAQEHARDAQHQAEQEGNAPAPGGHHVGWHEFGQHGSGARPQQAAEARAHAAHGAQHAAPSRRRALDQEDHGGRELAADRDALEDAQAGEDDRRRQAERGVARQQPDQEGRHHHRADRQGEGGLAAEAVADIAHDGAAQRPHHVADREHAERRQHLRHRIGLGKERRADRDGEIAVDREVVPFQRVADHSGGDGAHGRRMRRTGTSLGHRHFFSMFQNTGTGLVTTPLNRSARVAVGSVYWPRWMWVP